MNLDRSITIHSKGSDEQVRFKCFSLINRRMPYTLEHTIASDLDTRPNTVEQMLLRFVETGDPSELSGKGLWVTENPGKDEISRNICFFDVSSNICYTVGGIGLVRLEASENTLYLENAMLETNFQEYQQKKGNNEGGSTFFTDAGRVSNRNTTPVGVAYYEKGPYNLVDKISKTNQLKDQGFNVPEYISAGRITNLMGGEFGFSIYKTQLTQDYLHNLGLYLDKDINFKANFFEYIEAKYKQLGRLHFELKCSHGQPTITNAVGEICLRDGEYRFDCVIKDLATLSPLPTEGLKTIVEGPCPQKINATVKKSPRVAAIVNDLQIALTQEFNILLVAMSPLPNDEVKLEFLQYQYSRLMKAICIAYGLLPSNSVQQVIGFSIKFYNFIIFMFVCKS